MAASDVFVHWPSLADIADAAAAGGTRVSVIQAAAREEHIVRNGIDYHFTPQGLGTSAATRARGYATLLTRMRPDVLHVHSIAAAEDAYAITRELPRLPVLLQDHADAVPRWWRRLRWRRWLGAAAAISFTAPELADRFVRAGLIAPRTKRLAVPESSSRFMRGDQVAARRELGLHGDPCVAWVGHLQTGKDPLTVLEGVARTAERLPGLQLWCAYGQAPLLAEVRERLTGDPRLAGRVHLMGKLDHAKVETLLRGADLFVAGSHAESCGYALLEALACGVAPVVTDIPSFRRLTGDGRVGRLWRRGDPAALADALLHVAANLPSKQSVRDHFDAELSFTALGRHWAHAYAQACMESAT
ncbi:glycosyltransferase family 4 protein [Dyella sp.]|uniref:glycosyltransferase family 4 protein n=1 Tax=Dyella sp. TaxID=1869338 RepID=UPI002ED0773C